MEHSGTTITLELLKLHPNLFSGFECGLLFPPSPKRKIYHKFISTTWGISNPESISELATLNSYDAYKLLYELSSLKKAHSKLIDKTPGYTNDWKYIVKNSDRVPIVLVKKDPYYLYCSWKQRGHKIDFFVNQYKKRILNWQSKVPKENIDQILEIDFKQLFVNPFGYVKRILSHIGLDCNKEIYNDSLFDCMIDRNKMLDHNKILSKREIQKISKLKNNSFFV